VVSVVSVVQVGSEGLVTKGVGERFGCFMNGNRWEYDNQPKRSADEMQLSHKHCRLGDKISRRIGLDSLYASAWNDLVKTQNVPPTRLGKTRSRSGRSGTFGVVNR
jgi:hypothetical protein